MTRIELSTEVRAPAGVCFDCARDVEAHQVSMRASSELAIAGRLSGLMELGEEVTWRAEHFGISHLHTARITAFKRPDHFRDEMVRGRFKSFVHDHHFYATQTGTTVRDVIEFSSPLGPLGALADVLVLKHYLRRLLERRNSTLRAMAEHLARLGAAV